MLCYIGQFTIGLPQPIRRQQGTGAQTINQSAWKEEPARKVSANPRAARNARERQPIRALARTARMPTNQSACRNARESQPIRVLAGTARMPANQSACRNGLRKD